MIVKGGQRGSLPLGAQCCPSVRAGANTEGAGMDEKQRAERANRRLDAMVNAFNKQAKGRLPVIKKSVAESLMKGKSKELKGLFMSRIDLS